MKNDKNIWILIARKLTGEASAKDVRELEMLMEENLELHNQPEAIERLWNSTTSIAEEVDDVKFQ